MKRLSRVFPLLALTALASASNIQPYLALRKQHGINQAVGVEALETLIGTRTYEVRGIVKGTFRVGDTHALMLERSDGETYVIDASTVPMWLVGNEVPARLLVRATRQSEYGELKATLIGAAPEAEVARHEAKSRPRPAPVKAASKEQSRSPLYGPIGRSANRVTSRSRTWTLPASEVTPIYAAFIKSRNKRLSNAQALRIAQGIVGFSIRYGVDARLIMAMVMVESGFDPSARSHAGAMGLGQLMPGTARWMGVSNAYDSTENLYGTVKLIRTHLDDYRRKSGDEFESLVLALAAYNAGMGAVKRHGGVPPYRETQNYVRKVIGLYYAFLGRA